MAAINGTVERIVDGAVYLVRDRRGLIPWMVFAVAAAPAMAGAIGSAGVALLAPRLSAAQPVGDHIRKGGEMFR